MKHTKDMTKEELIKEIELLNNKLEKIQQNKLNSMAGLKSFDECLSIYRYMVKKMGNADKETDFLFDGEDYIILGQTIAGISKTVKIPENRKMLLGDFGYMSLERFANPNLTLAVDDRWDLLELLRISALISAVINKVDEAKIKAFVEEYENKLYYLEDYQIKAIIDCDLKGVVCQDKNMYSVQHNKENESEFE